MTEPSEAALRLMHKLRTYGQFSEFAVPDRQAAIEIDRFAADRLAQRDERIRELEKQRDRAIERLARILGINGLEKTNVPGLDCISNDGEDIFIDGPGDQPIDDFIRDWEGRRDERIRRLEAVVPAARNTAMNQRSPDFSANPWLGDAAAGQWELWRAGNEWSARAGWFVPPAVNVPSIPAPQPKPEESWSEEFASIIAELHREGWQAAIEAAKCRLNQYRGDVLENEDWPGQATHEIGVLDSAEQMLADLPYQPPEDRGDG